MATHGFEGKSDATLKREPTPAHPFALWKSLWKPKVLQNVRFPSICDIYGHFVSLSLQDKHL